MAAVPHNSEMMEKYGDKGLVIIGVCVSNGVEKMAQTVNDKGMKYPVAADVDAKTENAYHVDGYPDYYLIDRSGKLRVADCANGRSRKRFKRFLRRAKRRRRDRFLLHPRS